MTPTYQPQVAIDGQDRAGLTPGCALPRTAREPLQFVTNLIRLFVRDSLIERHNPSSGNGTDEDSTQTTHHTGSTVRTTLATAAGEPFNQAVLHPCIHETHGRTAEGRRTRSRMPAWPAIRPVAPGVTTSTLALCKPLFHEHFPPAFRR